jgi:alpha-tubulin suppressor-like RCC1 family protein
MLQPLARTAVCAPGGGVTEDVWGHGDEYYKSVPTIVEALNNVKAVYLSAGDYITFVVADNGDVHSFGSGESLNVGLQVISFSYLKFEFLSSVLWLFS